MSLGKILGFKANYAKYAGSSKRTPKVGVSVVGIRACGRIPDPKPSAERKTSVMVPTIATWAFKQGSFCTTRSF